MGSPQRPSLPAAPKEYDQATFQKAFNALEQRISDLEKERSAGWVVTNNTPNKSLDCTASTLQNVRDILGTLINALKGGGVLSK